MLLQGKAEVHRVPGNASSTGYGLAKMRQAFLKNSALKLGGRAAYAAPDPGSTVSDVAIISAANRLPAPERGLLGLLGVTGLERPRELLADVTKDHAVAVAALFEGSYTCDSFLWF